MSATPDTHGIQTPTADSQQMPLPLPIIVETQDFILKRSVIYRGYAARVESIEESVEVIKMIGKRARYVDVIPFAIRIAEAEDVVKEFHEDNGEWGAGIVLHDMLSRFNCINCMLVVTRKVKGCFPPDSLQSEKALYIKDAAEAAIKSWINTIEERN